MEKDLLAKVKEAGIVGAGGGGFPTHVKLDTRAELIIINGAECEPLLQVDQQLMEEQAEKVLQALQLMMEKVGAQEGVVALKQKYQAAREALDRLLPRYPKLRLHLLGNFYPAGDEQVTVYEVCGRIVPEGGIPTAVGVVVVNVETALNIYQACFEDTPVTDTYVTVTGAVRAPKTIRVPLGITVAQALELAGGPLSEEYGVINGGPMMGTVTGPEHLITKTTKGLIALPAEHPLLVSLKKDLPRMLREAQTSCMQCNLCSEVCPRGLLGHRLQPHKLMRLAAYGSLCDNSQSPLNAYLCSGCRLCEYACVMNLQPWKLNDSLKRSLRQKGIKNDLIRQPEKTAPFREYKRYPIHKLVSQLGLSLYDRPAPLEGKRHTFTEVTLPLQQHTGPPAEPAVQVGSQVTRGDKIACIQAGKLGANLHASISGQVTVLTADSITIKTH